MIHPSPPVRPQAILFDLDDTLWPVGPVIVQAEITLHDWLATHAPKVAARFSSDALRQHRMALLAQQPRLRADLGALRVAGLRHAFGEAGEDLALVEGAMACFMAARNAVTPYDDVLPGLARLQNKILVGSISNGNADLDVIGLSSHFKVSLAAATFGRAKPDPAIFHAACDALGVAPGAAVYVGDDLLLDVAAAQNAGMRAVWLNRTASAAHLEAGIVPDAICATFDDLLAWLDRQLEQSSS